MKEVEEAAKGEEGQTAAEQVPEELRLAYREDIGKKGDGEKEANGAAAPPAERSTSEVQLSSQQRQPALSAAAQSRTQSPPTPQRPAPPSVPPPAQVQQQLQQRRQQADAVPPWIDKAIYGIIVALIFLMWRKLFSDA